MLGFKRSNGARDQEPTHIQNGDVAKLFFDTFSARLTSFETSLRQVSSDVEKLKVSGDQSKLSDLVLLERLQKAERVLGESLNWIKQMADEVLRPPSAESVLPVEDTREPSAAKATTDKEQIPVFQVRRDPSIVQPGTLNSITTPTELQVLTLLSNEGPKSAPEIGRFVGRSREHTARLMKKLFDEGYVRRDQTRIPFRYSTVERVRSGITKPAQQDREQEVASAPPV